MPDTFLILEGHRFEVLDGYTYHRQLPIPGTLTVKTEEFGGITVKGTVPQQTTMADFSSPVIGKHCRIWITSVRTSGSGKYRQSQIEYQRVS